MHRILKNLKVSTLKVYTSYFYIADITNTVFFFYRSHHLEMVTYFENFFTKLILFLLIFKTIPECIVTFENWHSNTGPPVLEHLCRQKYFYEMAHG